MSTLLDASDRKSTMTNRWVVRITAISIPVAIVVGIFANVDFDRPRPMPERIPETNAAIEGSVTCNGKPVTSGSVVLWTAKGITNYALIQPDGKYRLERVPLGRVRLTVSSRTYAPDALLPRPDQTWPPGLPTSGDLPEGYRPIPGIEWDIPEPLPRPTPEMKALLDRIHAKYSEPKTADGLFVDATGNDTAFNITLTIP